MAEPEGTEGKGGQEAGEPQLDAVPRFPISQPKLGNSDGPGHSPGEWGLQREAGNTPYPDMREGEVGEGPRKATLRMGLALNPGVKGVSYDAASAGNTSCSKTQHHPRQLAGGDQETVLSVRPGRKSNKDK